MLGSLSQLQVDLCRVKLNHSGEEEGWLGGMMLGVY
jgi:hypothetical protein